MPKIARAQQPNRAHLIQYIFALWFLTVLTFSLPQVQATISSADLTDFGAAAATATVTVTEPRTSLVVESAQQAVN